jgi:predicted RNA methylase
MLNQAELSPDQQAQLSRQIEAYESGVGVGLLRVPLGEQEMELELDEYVANPEIMNSGIQLIEHLAQYPEIVKDKVVTDMGTGSGIIGLAAARLGAKQVYMPDIDARAVANAQRNAARLRLSTVCDVFASDLFTNYDYRQKSQVQIFNHPFFTGEPIVGKDWTKMMLGGVELLDRYFEAAPKYSTSDAIYLMPWLTLADNPGGTLDNDPGKRAPKHGFEVTNITEQVPVKQGLQQALFKIYELRKKASA